MEPLDESMEADQSSMKADNALEFNFQLQQQQQQQQQQQANAYGTNFETKSESETSDVMSRPQTPSSQYSNLNDLLSQQFDLLQNNMGPPNKLQLNKLFEHQKIAASTSPGANLFDLQSGSSNAAANAQQPIVNTTPSGKRANRTRFTDYQIKVLQEFFENNSYPKDSDLEYLSKLLLLSPRVIVVWFQVIASSLQNPPLLFFFLFFVIFFCFSRNYFTFSSAL
jgi:hypothetical protein